jgi:flagellar biosynthetic protein FliQ
MLSDGMVLDLIRGALWVAVIVATPLLAAALIVGLLIGLFQALTSIQEMTLTFVPKLIAMAIVMWASMGFMGKTLISLFQDQVIPIIAGG